MKGQIESPTKDRRHSTKVQFGAISYEVFCKNDKRREELGLPMLPTSDNVSEGYVEVKPQRGKKKGGKLHARQKPSAA